MAASLPQIAQKIFLASVDAVLPFQLVRNALHRCGNTLTVNGRTYNLNENVYVVGFGKAVYGMTAGLQSILKDQIVDGVVSVPHESNKIAFSSNTPRNTNAFIGKMKVFEGARNNLPDTDAVHSAEKIKRFVMSLTSTDLLIVLTSGGGSALLPLPVEEISLQDKLETIVRVTRAGGTIQQLNTVRKKLSQLKGGKLASISGAGNIITLIISDIVGDPIDLIASGPTVLDTSTFQSCLDIFSDLSIKEKIPSIVLDFITNNCHKQVEIEKDFAEQHFVKCNNFIVGSNEILVNKAVEEVVKFGFKPYVVTTGLIGDASETGYLFGELIYSILSKRTQKIAEIISKLSGSSLKNNFLEDAAKWTRFCLITAGETTVTVTGNGTGGRNQHLVLSVLSRLKQLVRIHPHLDVRPVCLLSAGTDGQDGPTDAAGAICTSDVLNYVIDADIDIDKYLRNSASYEFFSEHLNGTHLLKTGLTGTNVMDIQLLFFDMTSY